MWIAVALFGGICIGILAASMYLARTEYSLRDIDED
jgi:hypothetical protein